MAEKMQTGTLPAEGMDRSKKVKAVETAAQAYVKIRDERMALTKKEVEAKAVLTDAMEKNNLEVYRFDDGTLPGKS